MKTELIDERYRSHNLEEFVYNFFIALKETNLDYLDLNPDNKLDRIFYELAPSINKSIKKGGLKCDIISDNFFKCQSQFRNALAGLILNNKIKFPVIRNRSQGDKIYATLYLPLNLFNAKSYLDELPDSRGKIYRDLADKFLETYNQNNSLERTAS